MEQAQHIPTLVTSRLQLRGFGADDLAPLTAMFADPDVMRYIRNGVRSEAQTAASIDAYMAQWAECGYGIWAVVDRYSNVLHGMCGFVERAEIGYIFARASWGHGFASEAADACVWYGFEHLEFDGIGAGALRDNISSRHVLEKLGMHRQPNDFFDSHGGVYYHLARNEYRPRGGPVLLSPSG